MHSLSDRRYVGAVGATPYQISRLPCGPAHSGKINLRRPNLAALPGDVVSNPATAGDEIAGLIRKLGAAPAWQKGQAE